MKDIKRRFNADGKSVENEARAVYSRDKRTAQEMVTTHLPAEWRADDRTPGLMVKMARAVANAAKKCSRICRIRASSDINYMNQMMIFSK